jgi:uncharacterized protein
MIIDAHTHGIYGNYLYLLEKVGGDWARTKIADQRRRTKDCPQYFEIQSRIEQFTRFGIDYQVVSPGGPVLESNICPGGAAVRLRYARAINDNLAHLMEDSQGKLIGIGNVPLRKFGETNRKEMERAIKGLGLKGFYVPTHIIGEPLDSPEFEPFWDQAEAMDVPVYIHPRNPLPNRLRSYEKGFELIHTFGWPYETTLALARLVFSGLMERHPKLKVVTHHLGGGLIPFFLGRVMEYYEPDKQTQFLGRTFSKPLADYFARFYYDTAVGGHPATIKCACEIFGTSQIVFATDAPYGPQNGDERLATYPEQIKSLRLSKADTGRIMAGNIHKLLKM